MREDAEPAAERAGDDDSPWVTGGLIVVACLLSVVLALYACLLVPFRIESHLVPIAPLLAALTTAGITQVLLRLRVPTWGAVLPFLAWLGVVAYVSMGTSSGDVILPGSGSASYVSYGVMIAGMLGGIVSLGWRSIVPRAPQR